MPQLTIDSSHSTLGFAVRHMMVSTVHGTFGEFGGQVELDGEDLTTARGEVTVKPASINTGDSKRDDHLRSADFFDAENHPEARYVLGAIRPDGGNRFVVSGDLTIRGTTRPLTLSVEKSEAINDPWGNERFGLSFKGEIDRTEFGLTWNQVLEAGALLVGEKVRLEGDIAVVRPLAVAA